jgi:hypothetical protein
MKKPDNTIYLIVMLGIVGMVGVVVFLLWGKPMKEILDGDVFRLTYQFFLLAVLGGALSFLFKEISRERQYRQEELIKEEEKRTHNSKRLREIHSELLGAYNKAKKVRRLLRAKALTKTTTSKKIIVVQDEYDRQMQELIDAQLVFEVYAKRIKYNKLWFKEAGNLESKLGLIEKYLNRILQEYQKSFKTFSRDSRTKPLNKLPKLEEFVGPDDKRIDFGDHFQYPIRDVFIALDEAKLVE